MIFPHFRGFRSDYCCFFQGEDMMKEKQKIPKGKTNAQIYCDKKLCVKWPFKVIYVNLSILKTSSSPFYTKGKVTDIQVFNQ